MPVRPDDFDLILLAPPAPSRSDVAQPTLAPVRPQLPSAPPAPPTPEVASISMSPLFSIRAITMSTLIGSPIAGSVLLAANYRKLGIKGAAWKAVCLGSLMFVTDVVALFQFPGSRGGGAFIVFLAMWLIAKISQGHAINSHLSQGGKLISGWAGFGIALLCFVVITIPTVLVFLFYLSVRNHN